MVHPGAYTNHKNSTPENSTTPQATPGQRAAGGRIASPYRSLDPKLCGPITFSSTNTVIGEALPQNLKTRNFQVGPREYTKRVHFIPGVVMDAVCVSRPVRQTPSGWCSGQAGKKIPKKRAGWHFTPSDTHGRL